MNFSLFNGELKHELVLFVEMMLVRIRQDRKNIKFPCFIEANHLDTFSLINHFLIELNVFKLPLLYFSVDDLSCIFHLKISVSIVRVLNEGSLVALVTNGKIFKNVVNYFKIYYTLHINLMLNDI